MQSRHSKLYCLCNRDIQNFIVCAVETFETLLFVQSRHSKLYCLCSRAIRNFLVCVSLLGLRKNSKQEFFKTVLVLPSSLNYFCLKQTSWKFANTEVCDRHGRVRHSKLYCLCNRDIQNFIVCAVEPFETF